ncbi:MAG: hypothetical protein ABFS56_15015 [Pseudomonadota bacterium]
MIRFGLFAILVFVLDNPLAAASFDCTKARTDIEKTICHNYQLGQADEQMAELY